MQFGASDHVKRSVATLKVVIKNRLGFRLGFGALIAMKWFCLCRRTKKDWFSIVFVYEPAANA